MLYHRKHLKKQQSKVEQIKHFDQFCRQRQQSFPMFKNSSYISLQKQPRVISQTSSSKLSRDHPPSKLAGKGLSVTPLLGWVRWGSELRVDDSTTFQFSEFWCEFINFIFMKGQRNNEYQRAAMPMQIISKQAQECSNSGFLTFQKMLPCAQMLCHFGGFCLYLIQVQIKMNKRVNKDFMDSLLDEVRQRQQYQIKPAPVQQQPEHVISGSLSIHEDDHVLNIIDSSHQKNDKKELKELVSPNDSFQQYSDSCSEEQGGGREEKKMRYEKKKLAKMLLNFIIDKKDLSKAELFSSFSEFYSQERSQRMSEKNRKRRFDEILSVLKASRVVKEQNKIISPRRNKQELASHLMTFPQEFQKRGEIQERKKFIIDQLLKKKRAIAQHCKRLKDQQINENVKIYFDNTVLGMLYERSHISGENQYKKHTKARPQYHEIKLSGRLGAPMSFLTMLGALYKPYLDASR